MPSTSYNDQASLATLYIRNLNEKISSNKLKDALTRLLESHGFRPLQVQTFKKLKLRGQSFVTLSNRQQCDLAIEQLNTEALLGKPMDMYIAKTNSDSVIKGLAGPTEFEEYLKVQREKRSQTRIRGKKRTAEPEDGRRKRARAANSVPNKMLLLSELPDGVTDEQLDEMFDKYTGFVKVTYVGVRHLALVEFKSEAESTKCVADLGRTVEINGAQCQLQFAKK